MSRRGALRLPTIRRCDYKNDRSSGWPSCLGFPWRILQIWNPKTHSQAPSTFQGYIGELTSLIALPDSRVVAGTKEGNLMVFDNSIGFFAKRTIKIAQSQRVFQRFILLTSLVALFRLCLHLLWSERKPQLGGLSSNWT